MVVVVVLDTDVVVVVESAPLTLAAAALSIITATTTRGVRRMSENYFAVWRRSSRLKVALSAVPGVRR
jgi:hypothetical protein